MSSITENPYTGEFLLGEADGSRSRKNITVASGEDLDAGAVVAPAMTGTATADDGNTGDGAMGTITFGAQAEIGSYVLTCTSTGPGVAAAGTGAGPTGTGNGTITASPATGTGCKVGTYRATCIGEGSDVGDFSVQDPDGIEIGIATVAVEFTTHLTFTIADGATDFAGGDFFTIVVAAANSGTWSVKAPNGLYLPDAYTAVAYASDHINFTLADDTDFAVADVITIVVAEGSWEELDPDGTDGAQIAKGVLYGPVDASTAEAAGVVITWDAVVQDAKLQWPTGITTAEKALARAQLLTRGVEART